MKLTTAVAAALLTAATGCDKKREPAPTERAAPATPSDASPKASGDAGPVALRSPDWTFDLADPAKDYVGRYIRATTRYGKETSCILLGNSTFRNGETSIDVRNPADGSCGKPAELRDRFFASVSTDRIRVEDPDHHAPLRPWPDGSLPDSGPGPIVSIADLRGWKSPLREVVKEQQLFPLRVQLYGRGTYPVVTIAGWHALFDPKGDLAALKPAAQALCTANKGAPMGFLAELDHTQMLRVDCPDNPRWEDLRL